MMPFEYEINRKMPEFQTFTRAMHHYDRNSNHCIYVTIICLHKIACHRKENLLKTVVASDLSRMLKL